MGTTSPWFLLQPDCQVKCSWNFLWTPNFIF
jgi:hypothetical protein